MEQRRKILKQRLEREEQQRKKRQEIEEKRRREKAEREQIYQLDKQKNLEIMEQEQISLLKRRLHEKTTYLKPLKYLFEEHISSNSLFKLLQSSSFSYLVRIPEIYPKYNSYWMRIIYLLCHNPQYMNVPKIGYYEFLKIRVDKFCEFKHYQYLEEEMQIAFKQSYELFCKVSADLDIDVEMCDWIDNLEVPKEVNSIEDKDIIELYNLTKKTHTQEDYVDGILTRLDFTLDEIDLEYLRLEFGSHIQEAEERIFS